MIENILEKISEDDVVELFQIIDNPKLTEQIEESKQVDYTIGLIRDIDDKTIIVNRLKLAFNISRSTAYRRISEASHRIKYSETEPYNNKKIASIILNQEIKKRLDKLLIKLFYLIKDESPLVLLDWSLAVKTTTLINDFEANKKDKTEINKILTSISKIINKPTEPGNFIYLIQKVKKEN